MLCSDFCEIINNEMKKKGISCRKLGKMSGLTARTIAYYARGERTPNIYDADAVLTALGISVVIGKKDKESEADVLRTG